MYIAENILSDSQDFLMLTISGFLIVAACVMTFEARDSATKVVPTATGNVQKDQVILEYIMLRLNMMVYTKYNISHEKISQFL